MRITEVSSFPPTECGIANYTFLLCKHLTALGVNCEIVTPPSSDGDDLSSLERFVAATIRSKPHVVHFQHEFGLYRGHRGIAVLDVLSRLRSEKFISVVTLHTAHEHLDDSQMEILRRIASVAQRLIVHEDSHKERITRLANISSDSLITTIPHGVRCDARIRGAKEHLGWTERKVVLLCGYIRPRKAFHRIVELFPEIAKRVPGALLVIGSGLRRTGEFEEYRASLVSLIANSTAAQNILFLEGPAPRRRLDLILSSADVVVLPYEKGGQSGILADSFSVRCPVVTSKLESFSALVASSGGGLLAETDEEFVQAITAILTNERLRQRCRTEIETYIQCQASWKIVASKHMHVFTQAMDRR